MAESNHARWPALSRLLGVAVLAGSLLIPSAPAWAAASAGTAAAAEDGVILTIAPLGKGVLNPGQELLVSATVRNATAATIAGGTLQLSITDDEITSRDVLTQWLGPDADEVPERKLLTQQLKTQLAPGQVLPVTLTVPAASVGLSTKDWGTRGLEATLTVAGGSVVSGRSALVWSGHKQPARNRLGLVVPITVPPGTKGLIPAEDLASYTSAGGLLSSQLEGVLGRPATIAIDPMIIASIRVLGSAAPPSAQQWLDELEHATNDIFPLAYADSDIALEAEAGTGRILEPTTFQQAIDPTDFPTSPAITPSGRSGAPSPRTTPAPVLPKGPKDVLSWNYTSTDIAWPAAGSAGTQALDFFAKSGLSTTILSDSELAGQAVSAPAATVGKHSVLVSDEALSTAIRRAAVASSDIVWRQAVADAQAQLAILAETGSGATVLGSIDRATSRSATRLAATIDALVAPSWTTRASLAQLRSAGTRPEVTFQSPPKPTARDQQVTELLSRGKEISAFASALARPADLTGAYRLDLLALLATSWRGEPDEWQQAVADSLKASQETLQSVTITTEGPFLVVASQTDIPITLSNDLDQAVTVRVRLVPSNGRLLVDQETEATIDAGSAKSVLVPVTAKVGNGTVMLHISVHSPTGVVMADPKTVAVNVQAEWEGIGAVIFGILVVLFFGFGVWRNIARRRRERVADSDRPDDRS
jgi:hypothetical protein